mmetsp:Transcript_19192/g.38731  ORF Transcript_19192/g.38731 Transcript_19192/m.38731 type:complete len:327 (+) Transcript_19192:341-1321(+)
MDSMRQNVWLDCDPGHDDAFALCLAAYHPHVKLLGISTVHGNQNIQKTTQNAVNFRHCIGKPDIDIYEGQPRPLLRPPVQCPEIHGESGLEGFQFPSPSRGASDGKAVLKMFEAIDNAEGGTTIVVTGCQTNVALLMTLFPEIKSKINKIVFMGGAIGLGNTGPVMEFNIQIDPEAAAIVLQSGVECWMVPLEVTHTALVTADIITKVEELSPQFCQMLKGLLLFFADTYRNVFGFSDPPLHDPCAVFCAVSPEDFVWEMTRVDVETSGVLTAGQTVVDRFNFGKKSSNVHLCTSMDVEKFWGIMFEALRAADAASPLNETKNKNS